MATFAERIKQLRLERGYTHRQLADLLDISESSISMWETGQRSPTKGRMYEVAEFFDVTFDYLTGKSDTRNYSKEQALRLSAYSNFLTHAVNKNRDDGSPLPEDLVVAYAYRKAPKHIQDAIKTLLEIKEE